MSNRLMTTRDVSAALLYSAYKVGFHKFDWLKLMQGKPAKPKKAQKLGKPQ